MTRLKVFAAAAAITICLPVAHASTFPGSSGPLDINVGGMPVHFSPNGSPNLSMAGPFDTAVLGVPFSADVSMLDLVSGPVQFVHGTYTIRLEAQTPPPASTAQVTETAPMVFSSFFDVFFDATFFLQGAGSAGAGDPNSGDVAGEFGGLPGISNCVNGLNSSQCQLEQGFTISVSAVPEPTTIWLGGSALLLFALRRRK